MASITPQLYSVLLFISPEGFFFSSSLYIGNFSPDLFERNKSPGVIERLDSRLQVDSTVKTVGWLPEEDCEYGIRKFFCHIHYEILESR